LNEIPLYWLFIVFIALIMMSAFFSSSETGLMSLNRYRLKHLAGKNHGGAMRALELLKNPDKLITLILLGNNFINVLISPVRRGRYSNCRWIVDTDFIAVCRGYAKNAGSIES
jgi:Mg2+/Co2+ transporter CorB